MRTGPDLSRLSSLKRDLAPTTDVRAVLKGLLADQFGLSTTVLGDKVFQPPPP